MPRDGATLAEQVRGNVRRGHSEAAGEPDSRVSSAYGLRENCAGGFCCAADKRRSPDRVS
jgi:hypothetical protein